VFKPGAVCESVGDPHYVDFEGKSFDYMGVGLFYLLKTAEISIQTSMERIDKWAYHASFNTGLAIKLADGRQMTVTGGPGELNLVVDGQQYTGSEQFSGFTVARKDPAQLHRSTTALNSYEGGKKMLELDFDNAGLTVMVVPWTASDPNVPELQKGMNVVIGIKGTALEALKALQATGNEGLCIGAGVTSVRDPSAPPIPRDCANGGCCDVAFNEAFGNQYCHANGACWWHSCDNSKNPDGSPLTGDRPGCYGCREDNFKPPEKDKVPEGDELLPKPTETPGTPPKEGDACTEGGMVSTLISLNKVCGYDTTLVHDGQAISLQECAKMVWDNRADRCPADPDGLYFMYNPSYQGKPFCSCTRKGHTCTSSLHA
jgi:hypothetical protein